MENVAVVIFNINLLQYLDPRALWFLQARVNFKGVETFFLKLLFAGSEFGILVPASLYSLLSSI